MTPKIRMKTKGRRRIAIKRAHALYLAIVAEPGRSPGELRTSMNFTPGHWQTAIRYLLEDGLVEQIGNMRGARYYVCAELDSVRLPTPAIVGAKPFKVQPESDAVCTFCQIAPVNEFLYYNDDEHRDENVLASMQQAFHICQRCSSVRLPSPKIANIENENPNWTDPYEAWNNPQIGQQVNVKFEAWVYGYSDDGSYQLFGIVSFAEGDPSGVHQRVKTWIQFTFKNKDTGMTAYARGYRYLHRLFSHPDHLIGKKLVVSRERRKNRGDGEANWFWSWTPWPRIPSHLRNAGLLDDDAASTTQLDGGPAPDSSAPQHHIHSIEDHGTHTIIRVNKVVGGFLQYRIDALKGIIKKFLNGDATMIDLVKILEKEE
jgi:hypothetical protein